MSEDSTDTIPTSSATARKRFPKHSVWPAVIAITLLAVAILGSLYTFFRTVKWCEPWRINYPGVSWVRGEDAVTREGKRYLQAEVRFDQDVVSADDLKTFLAELVKQTRTTYEYYHIRVLNKKNVHVLDAVADKSGQHSITPAPGYYDQ
jgi:hypothetical protein